MKQLLKSETEAYHNQCSTLYITETNKDTKRWLFQICRNCAFKNITWNSCWNQRQRLITTNVQHCISQKLPTREWYSYLTNHPNLHIMHCILPKNLIFAVCLPKNNSWCTNSILHLRENVQNRDNFWVGCPWQVDVNSIIVSLLI